jgi:ATPase subunit of ABC transporter with duplicated ATPase domains
LELFIERFFTSWTRKLLTSLPQQSRSGAIVHDRSFIERFATDVWVAKDGKISK